MIRNLFWGVAIAWGMALVIACKPSVPSEYIQPDDMEDLLYDYHIAQTMAEENGQTPEEKDYYQTLYFATVLEKHGVTKAEFDSSLVYYYIRADKFNDIYRNVTKRLGEKAVTLGASENEVNRYAYMQENEDTMDIWKGPVSAMLIPYPPYNRLDFVQKADTSFRKGDSFMLMLNNDFIYQSGSRLAEACLAVVYDNDTIISRTMPCSSTGMNQLHIPDNDDHAVKEVRGYIYLTPEKEKNTSLKLMVVKNIQLIKFRRKEKLLDPKETEPRDSTVQHEIQTKNNS